MSTAVLRLRIMPKRASSGFRMIKNCTDIQKLRLPPLILFEEKVIARYFAVYNGFCDTPFLEKPITSLSDVTGYGDRFDVDVCRSKF